MITMAKQLNLDLNVRANTQQAKQEFQNLQKSLSDVAVQVNKINNTSVNTNSLKQASAAAQELQRHLSNAVNIDTGKINLNKLNASLKQSKTNIGELSGKLLSVGPAGQQAFVQLAQSVAAAERPVISLGSRLNGLLTTLKNTARWQISSTILHGFMGALQGAYGYAQNLNKSLNNIRIVTGQTTEQMERFALEANKAAKALSTSTTAYTDAALIYYQQGLGDAEVKERTDATIKLANVSRQSAEEVSSQMTAIWNNFKTGGKTVEYYADVITALGATTASSSSEIAEGLSKFASVADTVGLSYEKASAALATVVAETRQSADVVGTAFRTMFARIEGLKQGETLEDGVGLNKYSEALQKVGINVLDSNNQLKQMDDILDELGQKWSNIDKTQQIALAQTVAGVRQYTQFISLMDNYDKVQKNQNTAEGSGGTLQKQADIYAESWEAAQKRVKASLQSIYKDLLDDKFFIQMNNFFADLLNGLNNFIKGIGGLKGVLLGLGGLFLNYISDKITPALQNLKFSLINTFQSSEKQAAQYSDTMKSILSNINQIPKDNMTDSLKNQLLYTDQLSAAKDRLMKVENKLTDSEKMLAEQNLYTVSIYQEEAQALAKKMDQEKESIQKMMDVMNSANPKSQVRQRRQFDLDANAGDVQEAKALRDSYSFNENGEAINDSGAIDMQGYIEAVEMYEQASEKAATYQERTESLEAAEEKLREQIRLKYEDFVKMQQGMEQGEEVTIELGECFDGLADDFNKVSSAGESSQEKIQKTFQLLEELEQVGISSFEEMKLPLDDLKRAMNTYNKALLENEQALKSGNDEAKAAAVKKLAQAENDFNNSIKGMGITLKGLNVHFKVSEEGQKKLNKVMRDFGEGNNAKKIKIAYEDLHKAQVKAEEAQKRVNDAFANFNPQHMMSGVEIFSKVAAAGSQAAMMINSIRTIIRAWTDENMDPMEKFTTTLMSVGMIIPGVIGSISSVTTVIKGVVAATQLLTIQQQANNAASQIGVALEGKKLSVFTTSEAATIAQIAANKGLLGAEEGLLLNKKQLLLQEVLTQAVKKKGAALNDKEIGAIVAKVAAIDAETIALGGEAGATEAATIAQEGLNIAMESNPIGAIIAVIAALIAALGLLVFWLISTANAESKEEKAARLANEELERSKKAAEEAKQAYEDLKNAVSNYDSAVEALEKCTKGTQEWRDAFKEVLAQASALIAAYPQLLNYNTLYKKDGTLNQDVLHKAVEQSEQIAMNASNVQMLNSVKATSANLKAQTSNIIKNLKDIDELHETTKVTNSGGQRVDKRVAKEFTTNNGKNLNAEQAMEDIAKKAISENIDFSNNNSVKNYVDQYLYSQGVVGKEVTSASDIITKALTDSADKLQKLGNETDNLATQMYNASNIIFDNYFADKKFKNENEEIAYQEAYEEEAAKLTAELKQGVVAAHTNSFGKNGSYYQKEGVMGSHDIYANEAWSLASYDKLIEAYSKKHGLTLKDDSHHGVVWRDGNAFVQFAGQKEEDQKTIEEIFNEVLPQLLEEQRATIEENAQRRYGEMDNEINVAKYFRTKGNFDKISYNELQQKVLDDNNEIKDILDEDEIREDIAKKTNKDISKVTDAEIEEVKQRYKNEITGIINTIEEIPDSMKKAFGQDLINNIDTGSLKAVSDMYVKVLMNGGEEGVDFIKSIIKDSGKEAKDVLGVLSSIDLENMNLKNVNTSLKDLGLSFQMTEAQIYSFKNYLIQTSNATAEAAQETYKTISSILSKLKKQGDIIEEEDYQKLISLNPAIESFFTTLADGTHMLTGEIQDFKTAMQTATTNQFYQAIQNKENAIAAYDFLSRSQVVSSQTMIQHHSQAGNSVSYNAETGKYELSEEGKAGSDIYEQNKEQVQAYLDILKDRGDSKVANYETQIAEEKNLNAMTIELSESMEKLNLSTEDYTDLVKDLSKENSHLIDSMKESFYQTAIANAGLDYETTENYANSLMDIYEAQGLTKDGARQLAIANQRLDRGLSSLNDNFEKWENSLNNTNRASAEYAETIGEIRKSFADLLNVADTNELSLKWIEKWAKDADKMKKILDGDTEAIQEFRESAFAEMTTNVFKEVGDSAKAVVEDIEDDKIKSSLETLINQLKDGKISAEGLKQELTSIGDTSIGNNIRLSDDYTNALNTMLQQGLITEQQLNDVFASIGYKPRMTVKSVRQEIKVPNYKTIEHIIEEPKKENEEYTRTVWTETKEMPDSPKTMVQYTPVAQIESADSATGNIEVVNAGSMNISPSYSSTTSGKSSDSSNKSSSSPTTKAASHEHEVHRYSNEENAIKGLSEQYDRLNKAKDKAFGKSRIQAIETEIKHLKALREASGNYLDAIVGKGNADKVAKAIFKGENIGQMIANGSLGGTARADYNSLFGGLSASGKGVEYSAKDSNGNEWLVSDNYSLGGFNSLFGTNLQFNLDSYGNIQNKDAIYNLLQNLKNNENDAYSRVADPSAGSTTEYNRRMAYLEAIKERVDQFEETVDLMSEKTDEYLDYIASIQEKNAELITTKMEHGVNLGQKTIQRLERAIKVLGDNIYKTAEAMTAWYNATLKEGVAANKQQGEAYAQALEETAEKIRLYDQKDGYFNEDAIDPASAAELFSSIEDGYDSLIDDLLNRIEEGKAYYGNVLDYWDNKLDKVNSAIQTNTQLLEHFQTVLNLLGRSADYEAIGTVLQGQLDNAQSDYVSRKAQADVAKQTYERAIQDRERLISQGISDEALEEYDENVLQIAFQNYQEKADAMYQSLEQYIEAANAKFENESNRLFAESEDRLTGKWGSFDALDNAMERQRAVSDEYLTKTNQLYETNTLLRKLSQDIDKTDSRIAKGKLKAFADEIEAMKTQEKLSKTDLEIAKARYELLQAEIALEEARNAKSTVRLQRDNEGNYGYIYTADQDAVNDAEQNLADKQNDLYNLVLSQAQEYGEKMIQLRKEHDAELQALEDAYYKENIISREEFEMQLQDIENKYRELEYAEKESYETAKLWLNQVGAEGQTEAWTNSFDEIITQHRLFNDESENNITELSNNIIDNLNELDSYREYITEEAKLGNEELKSSVDEIARSTDELSKKVAGKNGLVDSMNTAMITAQNLATAFSNQYSELNKLVQSYADAADRANELYLKTVNLVNAQVALNHAQAGATNVSWNTGAASTYYNNDSSNGSGSGNSNSDLSIKGANSTTKESYCRVEQIGTGHWFYVPESSAKEYRKYPNRWKVTNLKSGGYTGTWASGKTGMYTGSWNGPDIEENGKLAFLHQKELVLNADDTENMLSAVKLIRQISQSIDLQALSQAQGLSAQAAQFSTEGQTLQQEVTIHAEFPNVSDHNEIEEALSNLVNRAAQFASRQ